MTTRLPGPLLDAYRQGQLAVLFGSGLSLAKDVRGDFPTWSQLPERFMKILVEGNLWTPVQANGMRAVLAGGDDLEANLAALDQIKLKLGHQYGIAISSVFRPLPEPQPGELHRVLVELDVSVLLTTNYDELYELVDGPPRRSVYSWRQAQSALLDIKLNRKVLFKIHGTATDPASIVMTRTEYQNAAGDEKYQETLGYIFKSRTLLLVAYGINDPLDLDLVFELNTRALGAAAQLHYALVKTPAPRDVERWRKHFNVHVIPYDDHAELPALLRSLRGAVASTPVAPPKLATLASDWPLVGQHQVRDGFLMLLGGTSEARVLMVRGPSGRGKTEATKWMQTTGLAMGMAKSGRFDFKGQADLRGELGRFAHALGLPLEDHADRRVGETLGQLFAAAQASRAPRLLIFDTFEQADLDSVRWIETFISTLAAPELSQIRVVVVGQVLPCDGHCYGSHLLGPLELNAPTIEEWQEYRHSRSAAGNVLESLYGALDGDPFWLAAALRFSRHADLTHVIAEAHGDRGALALGLSALAVSNESAVMQSGMASAMEAAAVPHWLTAQVLAALLQVSLTEGEKYLELLQHSSLLESFHSRDVHAYNVHEKARLAVRQKLMREGRLPLLAGRCAVAITGSTPSAQIERAFHLASANPSAGADAIEALLRSASNGAVWSDALASACEELRAMPSLSTLARGQATETLVWLRGNQLSTGDVERYAREAIKSYRAVNDARREAWALTALGDVCVRNGDREGAYRAHRAALEIRSRIAPAPSELTLATADALRDVIVSLNRLGDLDASQGNSRTALAGAERGLELTSAVAATDPEQQIWQQDLAISWRRVAELSSAAGQSERAKLAFSQALGIAEAQPERPRWLQEATTSLHGLADLSEASGDLASAVAHVSAALTKATKLASFEPNTAELQLAVGKCHRRLASLARRESDVARAAEAGQSARDSLMLATKLAIARRERRPEHRDFRRGVVIALTKLAQVENELDSPTEAEHLLKDALQSAREMAAADPADTIVQRDVLAALAALGEAQSRQGNGEGAWATLGERLELVQRWLRRDPESTIWRREELSALRDMAHTEVAFERQRDAAKNWHERARLLADADMSQLEPREHVYRALQRIAQLSRAENLGTEAIRLRAQCAVHVAEAIGKAQALKPDDATKTSLAAEIAELEALAATLQG